MIDIEPTLRPLANNERRLLHARINTIRRAKRELLRRAPGCSLMTGGVLALLAYLTGDASGPVVVSFGATMALVLTAWLTWSEVKGTRRMVKRLESAIARDEATVVRIASSQVVEFEEIDDEGWCFAFQISGNRIVFVSGQEFYHSAKFPNSDFSLVSILDQDGGLLEFLIEKHGIKLKPTRIISAAAKEKLRWPENLEVMSGRLEELEQLLAEE